MRENVIRINDVLLNGSRCCCELSNGIISAVAPVLPPVDAQTKVIDGRGKALLPAFYNTHTHAAMTLLRGYGDDMELFQWLQERIWPFEGKLAAEDIYLGTKLAILEMIRSGTVFFNDMYWHQAATIRAVEEMGIRAAIGLLYIEDGAGNILERNLRSNGEIMEMRNEFSDRIQLAAAPHAIYTVSDVNIRKAADFAAENNMKLHIHVSETAREVAECRQKHNNMTPVEYLAELGAAGENAVWAHCVHLSERDMEIIAASGTVIAHCPCSNMKLASGSFPCRAAVEKYGCRLTIGTDGCSSNNNLSMMEEMKFAALNAKNQSASPTAGKAADIYRAATVNGAEAFGINGGIIAPGKVADCLLIDLNTPQFAMNYDMDSDMVYAGDSSCIDTVICAGRILMENKIIPGSQDIIAEAKARAGFYKTF